MTGRSSSPAGLAARTGGVNPYGHPYKIKYLPGWVSYLSARLNIRNIVASLDMGREATW